MHLPRMDLKVRCIERKGEAVKKINKPIVWATFYITLIPLYAFIYQHNAAAFKVSVSQDEISYKDQFKLTELHLIRHFGAAFKRHCNGCKDGLVVAELGELSKNLVRAPLTFFNLEDRSAVSTSEIIATISVFKKEGNMPRNHFSVSFNSLEMFNLDTQPRFLTFLRESIDDGSLTNFDQATEEALLRVTEYSDGVFGSDGDDFSRYVYLSVVTMTTLGFGDIVPIASSSRYLISSQALIGIILMGLFLNSIAVAASKSK